MRWTALGIVGPGNWRNRRTSPQNLCTMGGAVMKAAQAVGLEEKEEVKKPVLAGEVEKAIALGRSGLIRNQKKAAVNLARLAKDSDRVRNQIVDEGGILPIIQMCRSKSQEVQLLAYQCMGQLALTQSNR